MARIKVGERRFMTAVSALRAGLVVLPAMIPGKASQMTSGIEEVSTA
jgi:hypothetical protein